jgi:hypothetical protein
MGASSKMLQAGLGGVWILMCGAIYIIIVGPIFAKLIPVCQGNTNPVYWSMLGGGMIVWIVPFIYVLITLTGLLGLIRLVAQATEVVDYDTSGF